MCVLDAPQLGHQGVVLAVADRRRVGDVVAEQMLVQFADQLRMLGADLGRNLVAGGRHRTFGSSHGRNVSDFIRRGIPLSSNPVKSAVLSFGGATWSTKYGFGAVWVQVDPPIDQIVKIDVATETVALAIDRGRAVTFTSDAVWVAVGGEEVQKLDPESGAVLLAVPLAANYLAAGLGSIWGPTPEGLVRLDDQTGAVLATVPIPEVTELTDVAVSDGSIWLTAKDDGKVVRIDPSTNTVVAQIPTGLGAHGIVVDGNGVWVTNYRANTVSRLDASTGEVVATIEGAGSGVGIDSSGDAVWASTQSLGISRIDPATNEVTLVIEGPGSAYGLAYDGNALWVSGTETREVSRLVLPDD